jgi:hydroxyacylglutathione hydrolase
MKITSRTVGPFQENSYLVVDETTNKAVIVDPGAEPEVLIEMIRESGATLEAIWLTHAHIDHIGGIAGVQREWPVPLLMHPADLPLFLRGAAQAANYGLPFEEPAEPDVELADGQTVSVGSLDFDVLHTPGHAPGHVVFHHGLTMLGGDLLFAGSIGRTDLPLSNPAHMQESLARICELDLETTVHPGHGPRTTIGHERATNGFLTGLARLVKR